MSHPASAASEEAAKAVEKSMAAMESAWSARYSATGADRGNSRVRHQVSAAAIRPWQSFPRRYVLADRPLSTKKDST